MGFKRSLFYLIIALCLSQCLYAQNWVGILAPTRAVDWSSGGVSGGIPTTWTDCTNTACNTAFATPTAANINTAIAGAPAQTVVRIPAGSFTLTAGINIARSNVILRGAGANQTLLTFNAESGCNGNPSALICITVAGINPTNPPNTATWSGPYTAGSTTATLSGHANLTVGSVLMLDQLDDSNTDNGQIWVCAVAGVCATEGGGGLGSRAGRNEEQLVVVTTCGASTPGAPCTSNSITYTPALAMPNWRSGQTPGAWWATSGPISSVGVENMSITNNAGSSGSNIGIVYAHDVWVKGVRSINSDRANIWGYDVSRVTVRDSYFYGTVNAQSQSYGIEVDGGSSWLVENNIFQHITTPMPVGMSTTGMVWGYNFTIFDYYTNQGNPTDWMQSSLYHHAPANYYNLYEGNIAAGFTSDAIHGTSAFATLFRNRLYGWETGKAAQTVAVHNYAYNRYYNVIGNVLGQTGYHDNYECYATTTTSNCTNDGNDIFMLGFSGNEAWCNNCGGAGSVNNDLNVRSYLMRWGNWDTVNNAVRFVSGEVPSGINPYPNPVPVSQALPPSFYLSSMPSWWPSSKPWPAIGPDVTGGNIPNSGGHAYTNPAQDCYSNVMGGPADGTGSVLAFNADSCYSSGPPPDPPKGLAAGVH